MQAGDYVEIAGTTSSTSIKLEHYAAELPYRPAIPWYNNNAYSTIVKVMYILVHKQMVVQ
jgi:hypothetical protein